ncbi:MAG: DoxX family protein [Leptolyngbyaceae cyanobacterium MO_188.B28]|nr:DoxX family protein [Leptolyngbyaceae cyanobacterium MO_188.B28]
MNNATTNHQFRDYSLLLLRLVVVFVFLYHGFPKALDWPMAAEKFVGFGLPGFLGPITGIVEVVASAFILFGIFHRWSNLVLLFIIAGAIATVQIPGSLSSGAVSAGLERDLLILAGTLVLVAFGPGALSLSSRSGLKGGMHKSEQSGVGSQF